MRNVNVLYLQNKDVLTGNGQYWHCHLLLGGHICSAVAVFCEPKYAIWSGSLCIVLHLGKTEYKNVVCF